MESRLGDEQEAHTGGSYRGCRCNRMVEDGLRIGDVGGWTVSCGVELRTVD